MRYRVLSLVLSFALLAVPVYAQHGGGGGGHGGGGGGHGGGMGGGHGFSGGGGHSFSGGGGLAARGGASYGYRGSGGYARVPSYSGNWNNGWRGNNWNNNWHGNGWSNGHGNGWWWNGRNWIWRNSWYPYGWGYPWWGWGYAGWGYPGWGWYGDWDDSSYESYPNDTYASTYSQPSYPSYVTVQPNGSLDYSEGAQTQEQIDQLQGEVNQLRTEQQASTRQGKMYEVNSDTVLVYRDGHKETVQNYAIAGKTLWIFTENHARKVPLSELNVPATKQDNEQRGVDFNPPTN